MVIRPQEMMKVPSGWVDDKESRGRDENLETGTFTKI